MARGWASKAVQEQMEASQTAADPHDDGDPDQLELLRRKEGLLLSRSRVLHDLESAHNPRYRTMLSAALKHLDHELAELTAH